MLVKNSATHYGQVARVLHWISVTLLVLAIYTSTMIGDLDQGAQRMALIAEHVSYGFALLVIMLLRFYWRQVNDNPLLSYGIHGAQKRAAISIHWFIYAAVICQCLVGIIQVVVDGQELAIFGLHVSGPMLAQNPELLQRFNDVHLAIANVIYIVLSIHILAAIYHQIFGVLDD